MKASLGLKGMALLVGAATLVLVWENPAPGQCQTYGAHQIALWAQRRVCGRKQPPSPRCLDLTALVTARLSPAIRQNTQRHNFLLFSIYTTTFALPPVVPTYHFSTLAILGNFYTYAENHS